jgi:hypothetical protein
MKRGLLVVLAVSAVLIVHERISSVRAAEAVQGLSGLWSGTKKTEAQGKCKVPGDGRTPATLDLQVQEDGQAVAKDGLGRRFEGAVSQELAVSLAMKAKSRCQVNGEFQDREWTAQLTGRFAQPDGAYELTLSGTEQPCEQCSFSVAYTLGKK